MGPKRAARWAKCSQKRKISLYDSDASAAHQGCTMRAVVAATAAAAAVAASVAALVISPWLSDAPTSAAADVVAFAAGARFGRLAAG